MAIIIHPHAVERMEERGATGHEVITSVEKGERFPAKYGRLGFRRDFPFDSNRDGRFYRTKRVEVYGVKEAEDIIVITVVVRYF